MVSDLRGQAHLKVWGNRQLNEGGYIFHNHTTVTVDSKGTTVFIQTDKPVYKPRQKGLSPFTKWEWVSDDANCVCIAKCLSAVDVGCV